LEISNFSVIFFLDLLLSQIFGLAIKKKFLKLLEIDKGAMLLNEAGWNLYLFLQRKDSHPDTKRVGFVILGFFGGLYKYFY